MTTLLNPGVTLRVADAASITNAAGTTYALPGLASYVTWQLSYGTTPSAISIEIQTSLDGSTWNAVATSTNTAGDSGSFATSAEFIRYKIISHTGGTTFTLDFIAKIYTVQNLTNNTFNSFTGDSPLHQATATLTDAQIKGLPTTHKEMVATPGANKLLVFVSGNIVGSFSVAYSNVTGLNANALFDYATTGGSASSYLGNDGSFNQFTAFFTGTGTLVYGFTQQQGISTAFAATFGNGDIGASVDKALNFSVYNNAGGNFTGGDAANSLVVSVAYLIFNTATGQFE